MGAQQSRMLHALLQFLRAGVIPARPGLTGSTRHVSPGSSACVRIDKLRVFAQSFSASALAAVMAAKTASLPCLEGPGVAEARAAANVQLL